MIRHRSIRLPAAALLIPLLVMGCARNAPPSTSPIEAPPQWLLGVFEDDYGSRHAITAGSWAHDAYATYQVVRWDAAGQFLIARNDAGNAADGGRWTRIDWMRLEGMPPYAWAFCLSTWNAATEQEAVAAAVADRATPRTGCGGHPFTRMKRAG